MVNHCYIYSFKLDSGCFNYYYPFGVIPKLRNTFLPFKTPVHIV